MILDFLRAIGLFPAQKSEDYSATDADRVPGIDWALVYWVVPDVLEGTGSTIKVAAQYLLDKGIPYYYGFPKPLTGTLESLESGADCSGLVLTLAVYAGLCSLDWANAHRGTSSLIPAMQIVEPGDVRVGDVACYNGHVTFVVGFDDAGAPLCVSMSGGHSYTLGDDPNAHIKLVLANYREDFTGIRRIPKEAK